MPRSTTRTVTIFSIEEHDDVPFMTMELIEGRTLDQGIPAGGLSLAPLFDIAIALADALSAAHRKHIIHRDLKPANVMVTDDGHVKVLDFGLARAIDADAVTEEDATTYLGTKVGTIVGTMPYMSPEQIEAKPLDPRTDLFSLGIMLYELATGERPFRGDSPPALISSILKDHAGQHEEAMAFARRAWDEREPSFILWARQFPQYRTLHSDPRFVAILREMDSPEENEESSR